MGSIFKLMVGEIEVWVGKNYLPAEVLIPFQPSDLRHEVVDNEPTLHEYRADAVTVARRLELLGFSMARVRHAYASGVRRLDEDGERDMCPTIS